MPDTQQPETGHDPETAPAEGAAAAIDPSVIDTVVLDIDGTLVDSNYHHALAWARAFRAHGHVVPIWRIHRCIGMGGDRLVPSLVGEEVDRTQGDDIRATWKKEADAMLEEIEPLDRASELLDELDRRPVKVVLATSGKPEHTEHSLDLLGARRHVDNVESSGDAETKPAPDLLDKAVASVDGAASVVIGDSVWDSEASKRHGAPMVALLTGGFGRDELVAAGAVRVLDDVADLLDHLDELVPPPSDA
ncbi:MAG TPA: HAD family hydrolase [Marmoricola sp.]|nr:HAD family hydrolase [Marmoricola sp.]